MTKLALLRSREKGLWQKWSKVALAGVFLCSTMGAMFIAYLQIALRVKEEIDLVDVFSEGTLFLLVFVWALVVLPHWREYRLLSLGILLFLCGNFSDLLDEFLKLPSWVTGYVEGGLLAVGAAFSAVGLWLWIKERESLLERLKDFSENQRFLRELSQDITLLDVHSLLKKLTEKVRELLKVDLCDVRILEGESWRAMAMSGIDANRSPYTQSGSIYGRIRWIVENRKPLVISDITEKGAIPPAQMATNPGMRGYLGVPLLSRSGKVIGVLRVLSTQAREFSQEEVDLLQQLANGAAIAIENAGLFEEVQRKSQELAEAFRIKSDFLNTIAHELKTPLSVMIGTHQLFFEDFYGELSESQKKGFEILDRNLRQLANLIEAILDLARLESKKATMRIEEFDLAEMIDELKFSFAPLVKEKGLELKFNVSNTIRLKSDKSKVQAILENLLGNAVKYTDRGEVELRINTIPDGQPGRPQRERLSITVRDTGIGIKEADLPHIFDAFYIGEGLNRKKYPGSGLGLSIVKRILELLDGEIRVQSEWGKGSTFTATLPLVHSNEP